MNELEVEAYLKKKTLTSIPEIQKEFNLKYKEVYEFYLKLLEQEKIFLEDDLYFSYMEKEEDDDVPEIYKKVLWSCIKNGKVSFSYIQMNFPLSSAKINDIIDWMMENHYIGPFPFREQEVLIEKDQFIELYGRIEEEEDSIEDDISELILRHEQKSKVTIRDLLNTRRSDLNKKINEFENKQKLDSVDKIEDNDFKIKLIMKKIILANKEITQNEFLSKVEEILLESSIFDPTLETAYKDLYRNVSHMTEKQFQDIKDIIVS